MVIFRSTHGGGRWQQYNLRYICTRRKLLSPLGKNQKIQESNSELVLATMGKKKSLMMTRLACGRKNTAWLTQSGPPDVERVRP